MNRILIYLGYLIFFLYSLWPYRFAYDYDSNSIKADELFDHLYKATTKNLSIIKNYNCIYDDIIKDNKFMYLETYQRDIFDNSDIRLGGEYYPEDCSPRFSTAIIVCYRQREKQLNSFLIYMHNYLRKQNIHYRIFIVEQFDQKPFNRAKLFNIGALYAMRLDFPCLIFHDVDLLPMHLGHLYACTEKPRHMCASLDKFRYNLLYRDLFGGAIAIKSDLYMKINGMSNMFHGWGGEDDDLFERLRSNQIDICRFERTYSRYTMLSHPQEKPSADRLTYLRTGHLRFTTDGMNSLIFQERDYKLHNLFTHILVET